MKKHLFLFVLALGMYGCATTGTTNPVYQEQKRKLVLAQMLLEDNKVSSAKELLTAVSNGKKIPGITDEALFRLALLNLEAGEQKIATGTASKNLEKILNEYPASPWRIHAAALKGLLDAYDMSVEEKAELDKAVKNLKGSNLALRNQNLSLSKENKELRQGMERMKNLDLELEMKKKR
jgi:outer membrane protein assembly factor BamD (BamD/ComL family)